MHADVWTFDHHATAVTSPSELTGYEVAALDGSIGTVDEATAGVGRSYLVVDTGPWVFGTKIVVPAGLVVSVDDVAETVFVDRPRAEIENAPGIEESLVADDSYYERLESYYEAGGASRSRQPASDG